MKNSTKAVIFVSVLLLLLASSYSLANAGFINAGVTLSGEGDDFFTIYTYSFVEGEELSIEWIDNTKYDSSSASLASDYVYNDQDNWTAGTIAEVEDGTLRAHAQTSISVIEVSIATENAYASASADRYGNFIVDGSGIVSFAFDYNYSINLQSAGEVWIEADLYLSKPESSNYSSSWLYNELNSEYDGFDIVEETGTMVVSMYFDNGDEGCIGVYTNVYAIPAVPLPSAIWMFASGIVGLVGIGRRKVC